MEKYFIHLFFIIITFILQPLSFAKPNVTILGTLHQYHESQFKDIYSIEDLKNIIRFIKPDVVFMEWCSCWGAPTKDIHMERRDAIIPLQKELKYDLLSMDFSPLLIAENRVQEYKKIIEDPTVLFPAQLGLVYQRILNTFAGDINFYQELIDKNVIKTPVDVNEKYEPILEASHEITRILYFNNNPDKDIWSLYHKVNYRKFKEIFISPKYNNKKILILWGLEHIVYFKKYLAIDNSIKYLPITKTLKDTKWSLSK